MFDLVEIKCLNVTSYVDCPYIKISEGTYTLKKSQPYFWQILGSMLICGFDGCDFVVSRQEDMFIQRIPEIRKSQKQLKKNYFFLVLHLHR